MEIQEFEDEYSIRIEFVIHRAIVATKHIIKAMYRTETAIFQAKTRIVEDLCEERITFKNKQKQIISAWRKVDSRFDDIYKSLYPHGGIRKNSGRPTGSRTKRTERLNISVTPEEKAAIVEFLEQLRRKNAR